MNIGRGWKHDKFSGVDREKEERGSPKYGLD